jgi:hypothetical protein
MLIKLMHASASLGHRVATMEYVLIQLKSSHVTVYISSLPNGMQSLHTCLISA